MSHHVFGIRHHGPGSARSLLTALEALNPDAVLIEGPPDADALIPLAGDPQMQPPVALLVYQPDQPSHATYYPFGVFSPEWQALVFAAQRGIPARFMDLPQAHRLALAPEARVCGPRPEDPMKVLASLAGYTDVERWWDRLIEQRRDAEGLFPAIQEAMREMRRDESPERVALLEQQREAFMRKTIRAAKKEGFQRIAVVCGAWHSPALVELPAAKQDDALLKGLPKVKTQAAWIPWTHGRLLQASGYGAGIESPGWYGHLWSSPQPMAVHWMARVARLLREEDLDTAPAQLIDALRLAETLASLRGYSSPGLTELQEATQAALCNGNAMPLRLIRDKLIVGEVLGTVPETAPMLPLEQDLRREQKRLRLEPQATESPLELDLRKELHRDRSHLLHRLSLLGIPWGQPTEGQRRASSRSGTFHERWTLQWKPELAGALLEAGIWGTTVQQAAEAHAISDARKASSLAALSQSLETALLAELPGAIEAGTSALERQAAIDVDVTHLLAALPALCGILRYGSVRQQDQGNLRPVVSSMATRASLALPGACKSLDDTAAAQRLEQLMEAHRALSVLQDAELSGQWNGALTQIAEAGTPGDTASCHPLLQGRACRLLLESRLFDETQVARKLGQALSKASPPPSAASWLEGLLAGSALLLLHDERLWLLVDRWLAELSAESYLELLPLLRRTFATFSVAERQRMGERARSGAAPVDAGLAAEQGLDADLADAVLPVLGQLLGLGSG